MPQMFATYDEFVETSEFVSLDDLMKNGFDISKPDDYGVYILDPVCSRLKLELAEQLIQAGADVNAQSGTGSTPLLSAIDCAHHDPRTAVRLINLLLDSGADIEGRGDWDKTPFLKSCTRGVIEVTQLLVDRGCDVHATADEIGGAMDANQFADMPSISAEFRGYIRGLLAES